MAHAPSGSHLSAFMDRIIVYLWIAFWYIVDRILVPLGSHFSTFRMRIAISCDPNFWDPGLHFSTTQKMVSFSKCARISSLCVGFRLGTLHGHFFHKDFRLNLNFPFESQIKLVLILINISSVTLIEIKIKELEAWFQTPTGCMRMRYESQGLIALSL